MESGVWEIFGTRYYTHGFGLIFIAPFVMWFGIALLLTLGRIVRGKHPFISINFCLSAAMVVISFIVVFGDVYQIGQKAAKLCNEKAGLHVYRSAQAESVLGLFDIEHWAKYGFKFVEYEDVLKNKTRYFYENGRPTHKKIDQFLSKYELVETRKYITPRIEIIKQEIKDRNTNEVLGESNEYSIDAGWADMFFYNTTGFSYTPWICSGLEEKRHIYIRDLIKATLNPSCK